MISQNYDVLIVGGGAAGFFSAINLAEKHRHLKIAILERGKDVLTKVKISGGGRCNVTHACFIPNDLVKFYPRGEKELKGAFAQFCSGDTMGWFEDRGVPLKIENDGRVFPSSNTSQTIINCFLHLAKKYSITILTSQTVKSITKTTTSWKVTTSKTSFLAKKILLATGSNKKIWHLLEKIGHSIIPPVPSLFTFTITDDRIKNLMGISAQVNVKIKNTNLSTEGVLLITHWGVSGPAILKLSAWGARELATKNYCFKLHINWLQNSNFETTLTQLQDLKTISSKKKIHTFCPFSFPKRLWESILLWCNISIEKKWSDISKKELITIANQLTNAEFDVTGKNTFKEEFVTAGGVNLKEVNFKTMESKIHSNLFFAGEILNIDAITGGFNFQNAWTTAYIFAQNCIK